MGRNREKIPLFWWSEIKFLFKEKENYGDLLSAYIVEKVSGKEVKWVNPRKKWFQKTRLNYLAAGSIIHHANSKSIVWGSGIISWNIDLKPADYRLVRGPETYRKIKEAGMDCPKMYGDPALVLPKFFRPKVDKQFKLGIIPHYNDYMIVNDMYQNMTDVKVIDLMTLDIEKTTREILECEHCISSSLHGIIVSHAYGIPTVWVKFSDNVFGDDIKYRDYFQSVKIPQYSPLRMEKMIAKKDIINFINNSPSRISEEILRTVQDDIINTAPF
ncbi:polysaccharide pyruvyl transferase family protein [Gramella jeungdoensis]|uniref:Polysaccharide pyruvyl transferase family protein n=1 Tax=Gramella jeungdoensis TaxID=708091 RepID=A0ABT0Z0F1_9FLAO|nr:polysaccharide pyruvyl transferase family protein [Gramella jeungdoensis]MCM8569192.1 polysaccharide pyruvyl transferase family protein [Gramella jeungdoensis]